MKTHFSSSPKNRLQLLGATILLTGFGVAAWIWFTQDRLDQAQADGRGDAINALTTLDSRKQVRELEIYYGKSAVLFEEFKEWLASLAHGKRLAGTVALASGVLGGGCFLAAGWLLPKLERARLNRARD